MFYSTRENGENKWKGERGGGSRGEPETAERGSSMKSEISMEWNRSRSQTDKCICAIDGQILFPPSSLIVNFEIVYPIDSRPSASGSKPGHEGFEYLPGHDRLVLEIAPLFARNSARNSIVIERVRLDYKVKSSGKEGRNEGKERIGEIGVSTVRKGRKCIFSSLSSFFSPDVSGNFFLRLEFSPCLRNKYGRW